MRLESPDWWYEASRRGRIAALALSPLALLYGGAVQARFALTTPWRPDIPVICIGNLTLGGAGKTPTAMAVAAELAALGRRPAFLTRGYGGALAGPHVVDGTRDTAADVGDEALLLAARAPTVVARRRAQGARLVETIGADVAVMDDGFQNPTLAKTLSLAVVDGGAGIGNGLVFPAGPLRAPLSFQLVRADAVIMVGDGPGAAAIRHRRILQARLQARGETEWLDERPVIAFSGIGRPQKFFHTLRQLGARLADAVPFPDHHRFTADEAVSLIAMADASGAHLVTTEKDHVRLDAPHGPLAALREKARTIAVDMVFDDPAALRALLHSALPPDPAPHG